MALLNNNNRFLGGCRCRWNGANTNRYEDVTVRQNIYTSTTVDKKSGIPAGTKPPGSWVLPIMDGGLSSFTLLHGIGSVSFAHVQAGLSMVSALSAQISVTTAQLGLIIDLLSNISASGNITTAQLSAVADISASISATGTINTAQLGAIIDMFANLAGAGQFTTAFSTSLADMQADIGGPSPLSPQGLAEAVWAAAIVDNTDPGTMGSLLLSAGGGSSPEVIAAAVWDELMASHTISGTYGERVQKLLTLAQFLGLK